MDTGEERSGRRLQGVRTELCELLREGLFPLAIVLLKFIFNIFLSKLIFPRD